MPGKSKRQLAEEAERAPPPINRKRRGNSLPDLWRPGFATRAHDYALLGATNEQIAELLEVSDSIFAQWLVERPILRNALRKARIDANVAVVKGQHAAARGYRHRETKFFVVGGKLEKRVITKHYPPSTPAATLLLQNRDSERWKDRRHVEVSGQIDLAAIVERSLGSAGKSLVIEGETVQSDQADSDQEEG